MKTTPFMSQYLRLKEENNDAVLFFRLGDFYEMFDEDAVEVSALLNLTLTHRAEHPMCGVPYHASTTYIKRLLDLGKKVAICEQVGSNSKNLMERKVVRRITPGTLIDEDFLKEGESNYILSYFSENGVYYTCRGDISTGQFFVREFESFETLLSFINFCNIREIVVSDDDYFNNKAQRKEIDNLNLTINKFPHTSFSIKNGKNLVLENTGASTLSFIEIKENSPLWGAVGGLLDYFKTLQILPILHFSSITTESDEDNLVLDDNALRSLEVISNIADNSYSRSLFGVLNFTSTAIGQRALKERLMSPLRNPKKIEERLDWVSFFKENRNERERLKKLLSQIYDIERISIFISQGNVKKFQLIRLAKSINAAKEILSSEFERYIRLFKGLDEEAFVSLLNLSKNVGWYIDDDISSKRLIKDGADEKLDHIREVIRKGDGILDEYVSQLKQETGISNLKLGHSRVIGYCLDVSPSHISKVPDYWQERQALVTCRRYTTDHLKELEKEKERSVFEEERLENSIYAQLAQEAEELATSIYALSQGIKELDFFQSLATAADKYDYVRPSFIDDGRISIKDGRHPIVERFFEKGRFVSNSIDIDTVKNTFLLITGPNMAGKSTYLRQNALIIIMAQLGSFVSATEALISPVDRIYSRLGFNDNIASGESTFLVEMKETALILRSATSSSFVILDEIGRGTGSDDGEAIAESVMHFMATKKIKTLFATHYLTLANKISEKNIVPVTLEVDEYKEDVRFLRKIKKGVASSSYGIHVAKLAGIPNSVLFMARKALEERVEKKREENLYSGSLFEEDNDNNENQELMKYWDLKEKLSSFNIDSSTPLAALQFLKELKEDLD